jgi:hypothetical protein
MSDPQRSEELQVIVCEALRDLYQLVSRSWPAREREIVSHFAFGFLVPRCRNGSVLHHPAQIGIEVAVQQCTGMKANMRDQVCKDLVVWPEPFMTLWDVSGVRANTPLCVIEWKCKSTGRRFTGFGKDRNWLSEFTRRNGTVLGFSVFIDLSLQPSEMTVCRFEKGTVQESWLSFGKAPVVS